MTASKGLTSGARALSDEQIFAWPREAQGDKIRHVPAALPLHEIDSCTRGMGYDTGLPSDIRRDQIMQLVSLSERILRDCGCICVMHAGFIPRP